MPMFNVHMHRPATVSENATVTVEAASAGEAKAKVETIMRAGDVQEQPSFQWGEDTYLGPDDSFEVDEATEVTTA